MVRLEVETSVRSAWLALAPAEQVSAARQAVSSAEVSLDAARKSVGAGTAKFTDVLLSLAILTGANRDLSAAIFNQINAWVELEVAIGVDHKMSLKTFSSHTLVRFSEKSCFDKVR